MLPTTDWKCLSYTFCYLGKQTLLSSQFIYAGFYSYYSLPKRKTPENILLTKNLYREKLRWNSTSEKMERINDMRVQSLDPNLMAGLVPSPAGPPRPGQDAHIRVRSSTHK